MTRDKLPHPHTHSADQLDEGGARDPYWMRAHHDWKFWIALVLMLTAMGIYITSEDLALRPGPQNQQQVQPSLP